MNSPNIDTVADTLVRARRTYSLPEAGPLAGALLTAADAYAVQEKVARELGWFDGSAPQYWKSGGASRDTMLTHAPLPPAGLWDSANRSVGWPFTLRGIEAEVAFRLGCDVDAALASTLDGETASKLIDAMAVSIEIVDSRWLEGLEAPALLKLADLNSHGALVLGEWIPFNARGWHAQSCCVRIGSQPVVERRGSHSLGDPAFVLPAWLRHATQRHRRLIAGTVVTTGTWVGILQAAPGDQVTSEFPGIGVASVQL